MNAVLGVILAAEKPNGKILPGDLNELWWSIVAIAVVGFGLVKLAVPPMKKGLRDRSAKIEQELGAAEAAQAAALAEAERVRASVGDAEGDAAAIVAEARTSAQQLGVSLKARADQEVADLRTRALADIESQKQQAIADLQAEVATLARGAAEAVVRHNLDDSLQSSLIDSYIDQVGA